MARRSISVEILGDYSSLQKSFKGASNSAQRFNRDLGRSARGALAASVSFHGLGRSVAFASSQFLGGAGLVYAFKQIVSETSRVQEETEKTGVVFGKNAAQVQAWSKTLAESFGVSEGAALEATGRFGNMLRPLGFGTDAAAKMSERLVELAADMASFNNTKPQVVLQALSSGLAGQVRPLRQYGVFLSEARIKQEAVADGIVKNAAHLTTAQKVQAAYNIILKDTKNAQGDVARNTGSLSVAMSKLTAGIQDTEAGLGSALLPTITAYVNKAAAWLNQTDNQKRIQRDFNEAIRDTTHVLKIAKGIIHDVDQVTGGFKHTLELLIGLKVAATFRSWTKALIGYEIALGAGGGKGAIGRTTTLGKKLRELTQIGVVSIAFRFPGLASGLSRIATLSKLLAGGALADAIAVLSVPNAAGGPPSDPTSKSASQVLAILGKMSGTTRSDVVQSAAADSGVKLTGTLGQLVNDPKFRKALIAELIRRGAIISTKTSATTGLGPHHAAGFSDSVDSANEVGKGRTGGLTLQGRLNLADLALAQAGITKTVKDDLVALRKKAAILHAMIAKGGTLAEQTQRNLDLKSVLDQINQLESSSTKDTTRKRKKQVDLLKKEASAEKKAADARKKALQAAVDTAKGVIGDLGQGPVATGQFADTIRSFGGKISAQMFTQDLAAQNQQTAGFLRNLHKLSGRGAPPGLIQTLLQQGQGGMDEAAALAGASKKQLGVFLADYRKRQKLITQVARMEVSTPAVTVRANTVTVGRTDAHDRPGDRFQSKASGRRR